MNLARQIVGTFVGRFIASIGTLFAARIEAVAALMHAQQQLLLTVREVAGLLRVSQSLVHQLVEARKLLCPRCNLTVRSRERLTPPWLSAPTSFQNSPRPNQL